MLFVWAARHPSSGYVQGLTIWPHLFSWSFCQSLCLKKIKKSSTSRHVLDLKEVISVTDEQLYDHFDKHGVDFLQFSFRWMNNLLMRELPLQATIRLWDTYLSEKDGFSEFHTYVCAAFL
uniref:Rab-GAP TBC domain-containing protein n=1 Tax=Ditylenchus dipsaci TaxID=166011 RepID=A0A915DYZ1_9BILA